MRAKTCWFVLGAVALSTLIARCNSSPTCTSVNDRLDTCDAGSDATTPADGGDAGNMNTCTCPVPDAAFFNPNQTPCCAGSSCVAQHSDGFSQDFYDCYGVGAWAKQLALDACNAYFDASTNCSATMCGQSEAVEGTDPTTCVTWAYQGIDVEAIGHVKKSATTTCECPDGAAPSWY